MRLNITKYREVMKQQNIEKADIERMTGIAVQTLDWIFENEYLEVSTLERLAEVVECDIREIALPDHHDNENVIEWLRGGKTATISLTQGRTITRVMKLAKSRPEECRIIAENADGSIVARVPVGWIKISPIREVSEEQKEAARVRMKEMRENNIR
ncbi:MAG: helix-turn-helix transcriptional regulator [Lachnospiraceae bacterium]|nr:helix-turn-helix transcriptional regulator [Lachnospiraceae bacterium]